MFCIYCGHPMKDDAKFCSFCGRAVVKNNGGQSGGVTELANYEQTNTVGLLCGILGVVFFWTVISGAVLGTVALVLSFKTGNAADGRIKGRGIAVRVLGIIALGLSAIMIVLLAAVLLDIMQPDLPVIMI